LRTVRHQRETVSAISVKRVSAIGEMRTSQSILRIGVWTAF